MIQSQQSLAQQQDKAALCEWRYKHSLTSLQCYEYVSKALIHIRNTVMKLSCACISTHIKLLCLAVAQGTVDFVSLVNNWQVGSVNTAKTL